MWIETGFDKVHKRHSEADEPSCVLAHFCWVLTNFDRTRNLEKEERRIAGVGSDTHGVEPGIDETFSVNRLVLEQPRLVLENLTNLNQLPPLGATLVLGVLRLRGGSGSPVSVLAFIP